MTQSNEVAAAPPNADSVSEAPDARCTQEKIGHNI